MVTMRSPCCRVWCHTVRSQLVTLFE